MRISDWSSDVCSSDLVAQLTALAEQVVAGLSIDSAGKPVIDPAPADPAFQSLASGVYWQVAGPGGTAQSPSLWDQSLPDSPAKTDGWSSATVAGPFDKQPTLVSRRVQPDVRAKRKSVGWGKSGSVSVDRGGRRTLKKKKKQQK